MVSQSTLAKLRVSYAHRVELEGYDAATRVARTLRELAVRYGDRSGDRIEIQCPVTQAELASLAAVAEPTAQRALRRLRASGIIASGYRRPDILDLQALDRIAGQVG
jgi:CRP/FNR family transcriptional regulator, cyclic AMP receptor protein